MKRSDYQHDRHMNALQRSVRELTDFLYDRDEVVFFQNRIHAPVQR